MKKTFLSLACAAALALPCLSSAVTITIDYSAEGVGEGFNDPTVVGSTTLGQLRRDTFEYAAAIWANRLGGTVPVVIKGTFDTDLFGDGSSAVLGSAGPTNVWSGGGLPPGYGYHAALANQLAGVDIDATFFTPEEEITAKFNSNVDNAFVLGTVDWYYGLDENPGSDISFVRTCLHEFGHGLGFSGLINVSTGAYPGGPGIYDKFMEQGTGPGVTLESLASDGLRLAQMTADNLYFDAPNLVASVGSATRMHAPGTLAAGSTYSHFREATPIGGVEELMEPILNEDTIYIGNTDNVFADLGWTILGPTTLPDLDFSGSLPSSISEGAGAQIFDIALTSSSSQPVTATLQFNPNGTDTATFGVDYTVSSTTLTIPSGTSTSFTITAPTDADGVESFTMRLTRIVGAEFATSPTIQRTVTINASNVADWNALQ